MVNSLLLKVLFTLQREFDTWYNNTLLKNSKVVYKEKPSIFGRIIIKNKGKIHLGNNITIHNTSNTNVAGLPHPTILCTLNENAVINIGNSVGISGASIVAASSITIGDRVLIGGGVGIWDTDFHPLAPDQRRIHQTRGALSKPIVIEDDVFIGARAIILKGIKIGKGTTIGAGSIISKNIPENSVVVGNNKIL